MKIDYDSFQDWKAGQEPRDLINPIVDFFKANPSRVVELQLDSGETVSYLMLFRSKIVVEVANEMGGGFITAIPVYTIGA